MAWGTWDAQDETCGLCRMPFDASCPDCKLPEDDCPLSKLLGDYCLAMAIALCVVEDGDIKSN
ncbi:Anaphase-promoting complex subunit 11 [Arabidopsis thaliana x Arabidopsis arenosa]|uniref:Anaphase-promoting complex subunit 11 n=1 Tax=Arabidopsis thaliana x Arabidopsis arenosa TaxID=1240361 RepID=A0A8T2CZ12_9BRAS|nr:Anaphase-promoting complex subunit 11 [Arabidopsis thaliana x Arabidopsis arenosa]